MSDCSLKFIYLEKIEAKAREEIVSHPISDFRLLAGFLFRRWQQPEPRKVILRKDHDISWITGNKLQMPVETRAVIELTRFNYLGFYYRQKNQAILCYEGAKKVVEEWFEDSDVLDRMAISLYYTH